VWKACHFDRKKFFFPFCFRFWQDGRTSVPSVHRSLFISPWKSTACTTYLINIYYLFFIYNIIIYPQRFRLIDPREQWTMNKMNADSVNVKKSKKWDTNRKNLTFIICKLNFFLIFATRLSLLVCSTLYEM